MVEIPLKGAYALHDMKRAARRIAVPFQMPPQFPFPSVAACRASYALMDETPDEAKRLAQGLYAASFAEGREISQADQVLEVADRLGFDTGFLAAALQNEGVKARLRAEIDQAMAAGVFGSPFFIADGEAFWGHDRLDHLEDWLRRGGW